MPFISILGAVAGGLLSSSQDHSGNAGSTTQNQTTTPVPWSGVQPSLLALYQGALNNFNGLGPQYYPGSTVGPQSPTTQQAQQLIYGLANSASPVLQRGQQQAYNTLNNEYLYSNPAMQDLYNLSGRDFNQTSRPLNDLYNSTGNNFFGSTPGMPGLQLTASGAMLNANPYVDNMFNHAASAVSRQFKNNVQPGIASMFSGAGRYGSNQMAEGLGQAQQQYGNTLDNLASQVYGQNYANERGLQQQAQGQLGQFGLSNNSQNQQALSTLGQFGLTGQGLQQSALSSIGDQYTKERALQLGALGMAPSLDQANYFGAGQLAGVGSQQDAYNQLLVSADQARYNFGQNQPNSQLQLFANLLSGAPIGQSSTGGTQQTQPVNYLSGILGGANLANSLSRQFASPSFNFNLGGSSGGGSGFGTGDVFGNQDYGLFF